MLSQLIVLICCRPNGGAQDDNATRREIAKAGTKTADTYKSV
jgi:hypothetical protein